jgi:hypothetical protein
MKSDTLHDSLIKMKGSAEGLFVIVDQMNHKMECFSELVHRLSDFSFTFQERGHRVLMSSSTSGTATPIFGRLCRDLPPFDHVLSPDKRHAVLTKGDDQSPTSSSPVLTARYTMYVQKALNLNKGVNSVFPRLCAIQLL